MFNRFIPLITSILALMCWEFIIISPRHFVIGFVLIFITASLLLLTLNKFKIQNRDFWLMATPPFFFIIFFTIFLLFLNHIYVQQVLSILAVIFIFFYLKHLYNFLFQITLYTPLALESFSTYLNISGFLWMAISLYGLINFLNVQIYYMAVVVVVAAFIVSYQFFWINKVDDQNNMFASILSSVLTVEFFWAMSFLPVSHFIVGLALTIVYYISTNMTLLHFLDKLDKRLVKIYVSIAFICVLAILLSAKWLNYA